MYLRFVSGVTDPDSGLATGMFGPAIDLVYDDDTMPCWLWREMRQTLDWFNEHLDHPNQFWPRRKKGTRAGVCWFRPEASTHLSRARYLAWLTTEAGHPISEIRTRRPGEILFRDDFQIVAAPNRNAPFVTVR